MYNIILYCLDKPKFNGPGKKKQACIIINAVFRIRTICQLLMLQQVGVQD